MWMSTCFQLLEIESRISKLEDCISNRNLRLFIEITVYCLVQQLTVMLCLSTCLKLTHTLCCCYSAYCCKLSLFQLVTVIIVNKTEAFSC